MNTSALAANCYEEVMVKEQMERERLENLSNPEKVIEGFETGNITLEEIIEGIFEGIKRKSLGILPDLSNEQVSLLRKACTFDEKVGERMNEVQKYIDLKNEFKDSEKNFFRDDDGKEYIKTNENDIFEILEIHEISGEKLYITYNHLTQKYTIFSYNGEKVQVELSDIENINFTNIDNWFEIIKEKGNKGLIGKFYKGGYYYIGTNGAKYIDGGENFSSLDIHGDIIIFIKNTRFSNNTFIISNGKEEIEVPNGKYEKIMLNNGKKLLIIDYLDNIYTIIDLDEMKTLINKEEKYTNGNSNLRIDEENNIIYYHTEEPRAIKLLQRLLGSKRVLKTIDFNTNPDSGTIFLSDLKKINKFLIGKKKQM